MTDTIEKLSPQDALQKIREIFKLGETAILPHASDQMEERNYDWNDLEFLFDKGSIKQKPTYDKKYKNWEYEVEGKTIEGDEAVVIVAIISYRELNIITFKPK
jgi:hypothetical protein